MEPKTRRSGSDEFEKRGFNCGNCCKVLSSWEDCSRKLRQVLTEFDSSVEILKKSVEGFDIHLEDGKKSKALVKVEKNDTDFVSIFSNVLSDKKYESGENRLDDVNEVNKHMDYQMVVDENFIDKDVPEDYNQSGHANIVVSDEEESDEGIDYVKEGICVIENDDYPEELADIDDGDKQQLGLAPKDINNEETANYEDNLNFQQIDLAMVRAEGPFSCSECPKVYSALSYLNKHKSIHVRKPFLCSICSKSFTTDRLLNLHRKLHSEMRPFACDECSRRFWKSQDLQKHKRRHSGEKPYICHVCTKACATNSILNRHIRTHTVQHLQSVGSEENLEIETEVQKRMVQTTDLGGLRMWQCADCEYIVKNSNDLRKHIERKHLLCQVACDICGKTFNCRYRLQQHIRKLHIVDSTIKSQH